MELNLLEIKSKIKEHKTPKYTGKERGKIDRIDGSKFKVLDRIEKIERLDKQRARYIDDVGEGLAELKKQGVYIIEAEPIKEPEKRESPLL